MSASSGDMVVERGDRLGWYDGPTLLGLLETVDVREHARPRRRCVSRCS
jgi:sulfate adenylyltransferase subunit 1